MAYYRRKLSPKEDARMNVSVGVFGCIVALPLTIFFLYATFGIIFGNKGTLVARIVGGLGFGFFFAGGAISGLYVSVEAIIDGRKKLKELKGNNNQP